MIRNGKIVLSMLTIMLLASTGMAAKYAAKVTLNSGRSWVTDVVRIENGFMQSESGKMTIPVKSVQNVEFRFPRLTQKICRQWFLSGDYETLTQTLREYIDPVMQHSDLPGNLNSYILWLMRAQFWTRDNDDTLEMIALLRNASDERIAKMAELYLSLLLIEEGKVNEAEKLFDSIQDSEEISKSMVSYVRGMIAYERNQFRDAIQYFSNILAFHTRDGEWMPAALCMEARVYLKIGQHDKALTVADEIIMAYPDSDWSEQGEEIKKQASEVAVKR